MADNNRDMHKVDEALYFVIEKKTPVELTDNGIKFLSQDTDNTFFVLPDIGTELPTSRKNTSKRRRKMMKNKNFSKTSLLTASVPYPLHSF